MHKKHSSYHSKLFLIASAAILLFVFVLAGYIFLYSGRILPWVHVGDIAVGSLKPTDALVLLKEHEESLRTGGLSVGVQGDREALNLESVGFHLDTEATVRDAYEVGRRGSLVRRMWERMRAPFSPMVVPARFEYSMQNLESEIASLADLIDQPRKDIRFSVTGTSVAILTDTKPGLVIDQEEAQSRVLERLARLSSEEIVLPLQDDIPRVDPATALESRQEAIRMIAQPLTLRYDDEVFVVSREVIGSWITSWYEGNRLVPTLNTPIISEYITTIADKINVAPQQPVIKLQDDKVVQFVPPRSGLALEEDKAIERIVATLQERRIASKTNVVSLPVKVTRPSISEGDIAAGITELIGKASTPFTGSPANRVSNIKNGVRFLTGLLVKPGEEFSTLKSLGTVDNTTGYLPELVIKGDRTIPEFGGGLCQVSTTLFRAVMNAGLPITARQNHSFRVSYYEKDANGRYIGPGLDATIYDPNPDFKFKNDTNHTLLIYSYVQGDKVTFELYGTSDGRTAEVKGPTLLSEFPAGDPIYTETDTLPVGTVKQVEKARPGGSTVAYYNITYPNGEIKKQEFKSYYRRWPDRFLVGTAGTVPTVSPVVTPTP